MGAGGSAAQGDDNGTPHQAHGGGSAGHNPSGNESDAGSGGKDSKGCQHGGGLFPRFPAKH
jgi:hypothetical protein